MQFVIILAKGSELYPLHIIQEVHRLNIKPAKIRIGLRTLKTAAAVVLSMAIVNSYGATTSKLIFAMLGAMAAMEPTFKESLKSCLTQIVGLFFGALIAVLLIGTPLHPLVSAGVGIVLVITLYNTLRIKFSPSLPCLIVVTLCTTPDIQPLIYAAGRFWDSAIGLGVGILINTLIFPYDNSRKIRETAESLDRELILFLEDMFDGDNHFPNTEKMARATEEMAKQLAIFSNQRTLFHPKRHKQDCETFQDFEGKARLVVIQMAVLNRMGQPGILNEENRQRLSNNGAVIRDLRTAEIMTERDIVTNYHVSQLLTLREELLKALKQMNSRPAVSSLIRRY